MEVVPSMVSSPRSDSGIDVGFVGPDGGQVRIALADAVAARFEVVAPMRAFPSYKRQRHFPGKWWSATTNRHIGYESWLERDQLMLLDFDPGVSGIASQPLWLFWQEGGKRRSHIPDYFARRTDGASGVIDCRPGNRIKARDATAFMTTRQACQEIGWTYELVGVPDPVRTANVRWLAGYRHPRHGKADVAAALLEVFRGDPMPLMVGAREVGDRLAVLPVLFHLMWTQQLTVDLAAPLDAGSLAAAR